MRIAHFLAFAAFLCVFGPTRAQADRSIAVDGNRSDWSGVASCFNLTPGKSDDAINLNYACLENDNNSGNNGNLYAVLGSTKNISSNTDVYVGLTLDGNQDCSLNGDDNIYLFYFPAHSANNKAQALVVLSAKTFSPRAVYTSPSTCGGSGSDGWAAIYSGNTLELEIAYGCLGLSYGNDDRLVNLFTYPGFGFTPNAYYNGTLDTLTSAGSPPDVSTLTAVAQQSQAQLYWTNPAAHRGVLTLRSAGAPPNTPPTNGVIYQLGQTLGNATVAYVDDSGSSASKFVDQGLTNGTRYYYKVYNHHQCHTYSGGNVPGASGIFAEPTTRVSPAPAWCYSTGFTNLIQPVTNLGAGVYSAGNLGAITSNLTTPDDANTDGTEEFRPVLLAAPVQNRFVVATLPGAPNGKSIVTGDQSGRIYNINALTGEILWLGNGGVPIGDAIQGQPVAQLYDTSATNAAFQAAHNQDLFFFATRNNAPAGKSFSTNNKVVAINGGDGSVAWTYAPGDLDIVNGGMMVDYQRNQLWVPARSGNNTLASLRVLSSLDGHEIARLSLGDIDNGVVRDYGNPPDLTGGQAYVVNNTGTVYGLDLTSLKVVWSTSVGAMSTYPFPTGNGFIASLKGGQVAMYSVSGTTVSKLWSTPIANPSGVRVDYVTQKLFVGSSDKTLHQLDANTGADEQQVPFNSQVGTPTIDTTASVHRLHVGLADGRLCALQLPLP